MEGTVSDYVSGDSACWATYTRARGYAEGVAWARDHSGHPAVKWFVDHGRDMQADIHEDVAREQPHLFLAYGYVLRHEDQEDFWMGFWNAVEGVAKRDPRYRTRGQDASPGERPGRRRAP
jgi:hypothetical protein